MSCNGPKGQPAVKPDKKPNNVWVGAEKNGRDWRVEGGYERNWGSNSLRIGVERSRSNGTGARMQFERRF